MSSKTLAVLTSLLIFSQIAQAQSSTSASQQGTRDPQATAIVQAALATMGGSALLSTIHSSIVSGSTASSSAAQTEQSTFVWTYAGGEFRNENDATNGAHVLVSNAGAPEDFHAGMWSSVPSVVVRTNLPFHIPALVLFSDTASTEYSFAYLGAATVNGNSVVHIRAVDTSDIAGQLFTAQDWFFNVSTGLPVRVQFLVPISPQPKDSVAETIDFANFQLVNGILVPLQLDVTVGPLSFTSTVSSVTFNTSLSPNLFAPLTAGAQ
jgi:hypothetical protein